MRVAIAGAGAVGRSIARELIQNGHQVLLIDKNPASIKPERVPDAEWLLADSCELSSLEEARLDQCDVVIAATGDDKVNLVTSLLAKTEFGVPRTVGRVNHPNNEWLFTEAWGVDVNVSTPRIMSALVEEAVTVGDLVRLFTFRQGNANLVELTLPADSPYVGKPTGLIPFPENCALVTILRDGQVYVPDAEQPVESGDELLFVVARRRRGRARAAARPVQPTGAESRSGGSTGVPVAAEQPDHRGRGRPAGAASPSRSSGRRATRDRRSTGRSPPDVAGQPDRRLRHDPHQARQRPAARSAGVHSRTTCRSGCQAVGSPVTLPTMKPTSGQPTRQVTREHDACSRRCRGCRAGSTPGPGRWRSPPLRADIVTNSQPMPMPTSALTHELDASSAATSRTASSTTRGRDAEHQREPQLLGRQPQRR